MRVGRYCPGRDGACQPASAPSRLPRPAEGLRDQLDQVAHVAWSHVVAVVLRLGTLHQARLVVHERLGAEAPLGERALVLGLRDLAVDRVGHRLAVIVDVAARHLLSECALLERVAADDLERPLAASTLRLREDRLAQLLGDLNGGASPWMSPIGTASPV